MTNTNNNTVQEATQAALAVIAALTVSDVSSVYSGKPGCCCGCKGNHRYNSQHVESASKNRGYAVTGSDINDRQVAKVLAVIQANAQKVAENFVGDASTGCTDNFWIELPNGGFDRHGDPTTRLYIVYPVKGNS